MRDYVWANQLKSKPYQKSLKKGRTSHIIKDVRTYSIYTNYYSRQTRIVEPIETSLCGLKPDAWDYYRPRGYNNENPLEDKPVVACGKCQRQYLGMWLAE